MTSTVLQRVLIGAAAVSLAACATVARPLVGPLVTDRPDVTASTETVPRGLLQLESGGTFNRAGDSRSISLGEALFHVGLAPRTELRVGLNSYVVERTAVTTVRGFEDASLGAKVKLFESGATGSAKPAIAIVVASSLPTGASAFRSAKLQPEVKLAGAWALSERVSLSSNVNYAWVRERSSSYGEPSASISVGIGLTERVGSYVEYYGFYPRFDGAEHTHFANGGLT
ncbi:MAG: transporter [Gemmatimonadota bacterium]